MQSTAIPSPNSVTNMTHKTHKHMLNMQRSALMILTFCLRAVFNNCLRSLLFGRLVNERMCSVALFIFVLRDIFTISFFSPFEPFYHHHFIFDNILIFCVLYNSLCPLRKFCSLFSCVAKSASKIQYTHPYPYIEIWTMLTVNVNHPTISISVENESEPFPTTCWEVRTHISQVRSIQSIRGRKLLFVFLLGLDLTDRVRDPASDSTLDSSTLDSEAESDYLEEIDGNEMAENKCTKCGA